MRGLRCRWKLKRRALLALPLLVPAAALAQIGPGPQAPIAALNNGLITIMHAGQSTPFAQRMQTMTPIVERTFNLPLILQNSVGLRWSSFSPTQKEQLQEVFGQYTVANYVANFDSYSGERFEISPSLRRVGSDEVVETRIVPKSGDPTRIDYVMRNSGSAWQAVDVLVDGSISRVAVQRSDFRSLLGSGGAASLISHLRNKVAGFQSGALK
jgi:phospholipid transport system substrate-binding protein